MTWQSNEQLCFRVTGPDGSAAIVPVSQELLDRESFEAIWKLIRDDAVEAISDHLGRAVGADELGSITRSREVTISGPGFNGS